MNVLKKLVVCESYKGLDPLDVLILLEARGLWKGDKDESK